MIGAQIGNIPAVSIYKGDQYSSGRRYPQFNGKTQLSGNLSSLSATLPNYHPTTEFTVSGWVFPDDYTFNHGEQSSYGFTIFSSDPSSSIDRYPLWVRIWDGKLIVRVFQEGTDNTNPLDIPIPLNQWSHIGICADRSGTVEVYLNSVEVASFTPVNNGGNITDSFIIGDLRQSRNICFSGFVKRVGIWNEKKSSQFMQELAYKGNIDLSDESLVSFWKLESNFDDSSPSNITLASQNATILP